MQVATAKDLKLGSTGVFVVDKPKGVTSHDVVNQVRRITGERRVGHAGTLDPLATGALIILVGREFTKQQSTFLKQDKTYRCSAHLGVITDSYDADGRVLSVAPWQHISHISREQLLKVLPLFTGNISQQVPAFSAVKVAGRKLYDKARAGEDIAQLPTREVSIHQLELLDFHSDASAQQASFTIDVTCSSGTYIRSLVHDIGQELGVGAHVVELRRLAVGKIGLESNSAPQLN